MTAAGAPYAAVTDEALRALFRPKLNRIRFDGIHGAFWIGDSTRH